MNERIIELAKKLKALADQGVGGEKQNAITMLESLMKKHGITMDMINENDVTDHQFIVPNDRRTQLFFTQIVGNVMGKNVRWGRYVKHPRAKERYFVTCTASEAIEIEARFDFFLPIWENELEIFYSAFIQKNHLYRKPSKEDDKQEELSPEEKERLLKMLKMMQTMEKHIFTKQIGYTKK